MAVAAAMFMTSCSADEGTEPGNDSKAYVMTNTYSVAPPLDADADFKVRVSTNSATESAYILLEKHADYSKHIAELGQEGYNDFVVKNGGLVKGVKGQSEVDTLFYGLKGEYMATVVAVNAKGQAQSLSSCRHRSCRLCPTSCRARSRPTVSSTLMPTILQATALKTSTDRATT